MPTSHICSRCTYEKSPTKRNLIFDFHISVLSINSKFKDLDKKYLRITLIVMYALTYSCETDSGISNLCFNADLNDSIKYEITRKWIFYGFKEPWNIRCRPPNVREMTIEFIGSNTVVGASSCNSFGGNYSISDENSLHIDNLVTTDKHCINDTIMYWEEKYYYALENAISYNITGNRLLINTSLNEVLIFGTY